MRTEPLRVFLVDDHQIVREGLRAVLEEEADLVVVGEAGSGDEALQRVPGLAPDVVLIDLVMPGMPALEAIRQLRRLPGVQVVVLTTFIAEGQVQAALEAGAIGYLLKDVVRNDLVRAIQAAAQGVPWLHPEAQRHLVQRAVARPAAAAHDALTPRERDVLALVGRGRSNKQVAAALHLSEGTVKGYVSTVLEKLGVEDRTQAALYAVKHGLVEPS
jgi:NarL family two-component system response regulator LiaR